MKLKTKWEDNKIICHGGCGHKGHLMWSYKRYSYCQQCFIKIKGGKLNGRSITQDSRSD